MRRFLLTLAFLLAATAACPAQFLSDTVTLAFVGDVMQHIAQLQDACKQGGEYDYSAYFKYVKPYFDQADFTVANMEFTCGVKPYTGYPCFSAPEALAAEARRSGIDLFETANNHICDKGLRGLDSTMAIYRRNGWDYTGIYQDTVSRFINDPAVYEIKGIRIAFINITYGTNGNRIPAPRVVNLLDTASVAASILRARERGAELIVALPHWGTEYRLKPDASQIRWERFLYSHGVDIIIGSHPHVVEPVVALTDSLSGEIRHITAYSLGNYISNMSIRYGRIGALAVVRVVKTHGTEKIEILQPEVHYLWCCKAGRLEKGWTTAPIEWLLSDGPDGPGKALDTSEKAKISLEWNLLRKELGI
jgi:hypothetical protein